MGENDDSAFNLKPGCLSLRRYMEDEEVQKRNERQASLQAAAAATAIAGDAAGQPVVDGLQQPIL